MKCLVIGHCQTGIILEMLKLSPSFMFVYNEIHWIFKVNTTEETMQDVLTDLVPRMDLIISPPISDNSGIFSTSLLIKHIKPPTKHYLVIGCEFLGFEPKMCFYNKNMGEDSYYLIALSSDVIKSLLNDSIENTMILMQDKNLYDRKTVIDNFNKCLQKFMEREHKMLDHGHNIDIKIGDFIAQYYDKKMLFHSYNHPTNFLLFEIVRRLLQRLGLPNDIDTSKIKEEYLLFSYSLPPLNSVRHHLGIADYETYGYVTGNKKCEDLYKFLSDTKNMIDKLSDQHKLFINSV